MIKFNDESIFVGEIKQLLSHFNLPNFPIYSKDVNYGEGQFYLKNNSVYTIKNGVETKVSNYYFNKELLNLTRNLEIRNLIYDTYTHVYLGEFLRFIRDYLNLDLMSLYNCFTNKTTNNININKNNIIFNSNSTDCVIFEVPIKYDKQYTIAIDCSTKIELLPCILTDNSLKIKDEDIYVDNYQTISNSLFKKPFIYRSPKKQDLGEVNWYEKERNLKLLLKIPSNCTSSIVILEGDYRLNANIIISTPYKEKITKVIFDNSPYGIIIGFGAFMDTFIKNLYVGRDLEYRNYPTILDGYKRKEPYEKTPFLSLEHIVIGDYMTSIKNGDILDVADVKTIVFGESVNQITALKNTENLEYIICKSHNPPSVKENFSMYIILNIPLYVPSGSVQLYKNAYPWKEFIIKEISR